MSIRVLAMLVALMVPCGFATAAEYTRDDAVKMVEKAAAFLRANGKVEPKSSYLSKTGDMIIVCGIYNP